jgi:hypothetical protein
MTGDNWVMSWGGNPTTTELTPSGQRRFRLRFDYGVFSYRANPVPFGVLPAQALRDGMNAQYPRYSTSFSTAPQGNWVGKYGSGGYVLAGWNGSDDLVSMPGVSARLVRGVRWQWAEGISDVRALQSPDRSARKAATYTDSDEVKVSLSFDKAYRGSINLYAVDWEPSLRRQSVSVNGSTVLLSADFSKGAWMSFPVNIPAGGTAEIVVHRVDGVNAVLSGIFLN